MKRFQSALNLLMWGCFIGATLSRPTYAQAQQQSYPLPKLDPAKAYDVKRPNHNVFLCRYEIMDDSHCTMFPDRMDFAVTPDGDYSILFVVPISNDSSQTRWDILKNQAGYEMRGNCLDGSMPKFYQYNEKVQPESLLPSYAMPWQYQLCGVFATDGVVQYHNDEPKPIVWSETLDIVENRGKPWAR